MSLCLELPACSPSGSIRTTSSVPHGCRALRQSTDRYTFDYTPPMGVSLQVPPRTAAALSSTLLKTLNLRSFSCRINLRLALLQDLTLSSVLSFLLCSPCKSTLFLSRGGGTRTHTVRILSPTSYVHGGSLKYRIPHR